MAARCGRRAVPSMFASCSATKPPRLWPITVGAFGCCCSMPDDAKPGISSTWGPLPVTRTSNGVAACAGRTILPSASSAAIASGRSSRLCARRTDATSARASSVVKGRVYAVPGLRRGRMQPHAIAFAVDDLRDEADRAGQLPMSVTGISNQWRASRCMAVSSCEETPSCAEAADSVVSAAWSRVLSSCGFSPASRARRPRRRRRCRGSRPGGSSPRTWCRAWRRNPGSP